MILNPQSILGDWIERLELDKIAGDDDCFVAMVPLSDRVLEERRLELEPFQFMKDVEILNHFGSPILLGIWSRGSLKEALEKYWGEIDRLKAVIVKIYYNDETYCQMMVYFKPD